MQPTAILSLGDDRTRSYMAFDERGEVIETTELDSAGKPDWSQGGICDHRGVSGEGGFTRLHRALTDAETLAKDTGFVVQRIKED